MPELNADDGYRQAAALNAAPPPVLSDQLAAGPSPADQLLWALGLAANSGDPADDAVGVEEHALREAALNGAVEGFLAQDEAARAELAGVGGEQILTQQLPQLAAGLAGTLSGALGAVLQPLTSLPQQLIQGAQQAVQTGVGLIGQVAGAQMVPGDLDIAGLGDDLTGAADEFGGELGSDLGADFGALGDDGDGALPGVDGIGGFGGTGDLAGPGFGAGGIGFGASGIGGGLGAAVPVLGPPVAPSPATSLSAASGQPATVTTAATTAAAGPGGMTGFPMVPPAALGGAPGDRDAKADTRRVSVPPVRNGAPVTGRLTPPATAPVVTRSVDGAPVAIRRDAPGAATNP